MKTLRTQSKTGFAMLFTVLIVSIVLAISLGVSNIVFKQTVLSSTARASFEAFTQADRGVECGQYVETKIVRSGTTFPSTFDCGGVALVGTPFMTGYTLDFVTKTSTTPCFRVEVIPTPPPAPVPGGGTPVPGAEITSRGYNRCDLTSDRTVERVLQVTF